MPNTNTERKQGKQSQGKAFDKNYGHLQPQAVDIEKVVLGALMIDKDAFSMVSETLRPETFYEPRHQKIYNAIQTLSMNENPVDIMTVVDELKREGTIDDVGGAPYIVELSSHVASSAHIEYHARILAQKYLARQLISYASIVETKAFDETQDVDELMQEAEGSLFELSQRNMKKDYTQVDPVITKAIDILQKAQANAGGLTGVPTGYEELDKKTSGWQSSDLVIIAGRPAMGKTSFALSLAKNIAVDYNTPIAFFSLEMNNVQLVNRLISNVCEIPGNKMLNGQLAPDEWERLDKNIRLLQGSPLYIDDTPGLSIFELRTKARRLVREKGVKIIMIDYLQLMTGTKRTDNRAQEVAEITRSLKLMAKDLKIPVVTCSQLNRQSASGKGKDHKPTMSELRESGSIEQDADIILLLYRESYFDEDKGESVVADENKAQVIIAKNRHGGTTDVDLNWNGQYTLFTTAEYNRNEP